MFNNEYQDISNLLEEATCNITQIKSILSIFSKISNKNNGIKSLDEVCEVSIGIITKNNNAFVIDQRNNDFNDTEKNLLMPVIEGKDIDRYSLKYNNKMLIYIKPEISKDKIPNLIYHLNLHIKNKDKNKDWYILKSSIKDIQFKNEKIIGKKDIQKNSGLKFTVDNNGYYSLDTGIIITSTSNVDINYICGVLNSKLANVYYRFISNVLEYDDKKVIIELLKKIPIIVEDNIIEDIKNIVKENIELNKRILDFEIEKWAIFMDIDKLNSVESKIREYEEIINKNIKKLDEEIYKVFKLNKNEIKLINEYHNRISKIK